MILPAPQYPKAVIFVDGQNLFHAVKKAFGYTFPNSDITKLSQAICSAKGWVVQEIRFYTGIPDITVKPLWHDFWIRRLTAMGQTGIKVFKRNLRYHNQTVTLPNGVQGSVLVGQEKGIDVRIAIDVIRLAHAKRYDVAIILSQDQDLSEVAEEIRVISTEQNRWIKIASAFPVSPTSTNNRGINKTDWIHIDKQTYDACIDPRDYRNPTS